MNDFANAFLLTYATLFPIINPVGNVPLLLSMTRGLSNAERNTLARRVAINSFILLLGSILMGSHVLEFFGISLPAVRIGGGLVVTAFGWRMLNSGVSADNDTTAALPRPKPLDTFYPFTMPLTVGPGAISVAIALGSQRPAISDLPHLAVLGGAALTGLLAMSATIYLCYRFAEATVARLGAGGTNVVVRLSAFLLVCIGIQIIWTGWTGLNALPH
ncbi:MAG: NAAT family transporter [Alphaproteobacteria bacterium]|nr:NAAT family transporter [Alphaproteobacteria bacterium]MDE1987912.1 NAAT family transporter [Alphaproteobacteria bacterium]MDE2164560.1 NAAT family transporter [Alphaproteobacteria bacterium]